MSDQRTTDLMRLASRGDENAKNVLFGRFRRRLRRMIDLRLDLRLRHRVDPSDVLQETLLEATKRFDGYSKSPAMPFFSWLRFIAFEKIKLHYRRHIRTKKRDARKEQSLNLRFVGNESDDMVLELSRPISTPSERVMRSEIQGRLRRVLTELRPGDREVLVLRHFEQRTNQEVAEQLGIDPSAASTRYIRALQRLKDTLAENSSFSDE